MNIDVDTLDDVGRAIASQGVYDILTTELLHRLTSPGDHTIDGGANVGYMTSILAARSGPRGEVLSFEPHPVTFRLLKKNVDSWNKTGRYAPIVPHQVAVGECDGKGVLVPPPTTHLSLSAVSSDQSQAGIGIEIVRLEPFIESRKEIGVVKLDIQGYEAAALRGIGDDLKTGKIRDIVFEEEAPYPAESHRVLEGAGYKIFWFEEHLRGPKIIAPMASAKKRSYDVVPSYVATMDAKRVELLVSQRGWHSF